MSQSHETFGKYILLEKLAMGGMAEIYLAKKMGVSGVSKFVAVKRILPQFNEQSEFLDMFKDEAKISMGLTHANIVSIFDFGFEKNQYYLAMDYVEGRNLRQILNKMKKSGVTFTTEQILYVIKEVAGGLDHAHRGVDNNTGKPLNIIHRDMSPQNVMISFEGEVKIVDFGIAKAETQLETTRAGTLKGKFGYMSPEQAEGQTVDLRTDIFALGIVLWELLANDRLFVANNEVNTLRKIRDCQIPSLRKINPNISPELERIVSKALAKDRNLRYQTASAFHRELSRFLNRQYPDFSSHDFSVFIKNLFAGEILESRKKMVEYAKIEIKTRELNEKARLQNKAMSNEVTETNTVTEAESEDSYPSMKEAAQASAPPSSRYGRSPYSTQPPSEPPQAQPKRPTAQESAAVPERPAQQSLAQQQAAQQPSAKPQLSQKDQTFDRTPENGGRAEFQAPQESKNSSQLRVDRSSFYGTVSPSQRDSNGTQVGTFNSGTRSFSRTNVTTMYKKSSSLPVALMTLAVVAGTAFYVLQNGLNFSQLDPRLRQALCGVIDCKVEVVLTTNTLESPSISTFDIAINSMPVGAEILVNDKPVGAVTPDVLKRPANEDIKITLRLNDYISHEERFLLTGNRAMNVYLRKAKKGYLDITVVGSGQILIDDVVIAQQSPANRIPIPADKEVVVRAWDPNTKAFDEIKVSVSENQKKRVTLIPRANMRSNP